MNYALFAIGCYILMRGLQVLFEESASRLWFKVLIKVVALGTIYAALSSLFVWYYKIQLLGFDPSK